MNEQPKVQLRKAFIQTLERLMGADKTITLIIGDVGFSFMEPVIQKFPKQFINGGISEQNIMTMAAGMASEGLRPVVYTMSNFILLRPLEQLRNDICYNNSNVKLFAVKGGPSYKFLGYSHNLAEGEEQAILSTLPNIQKYFPATEEECSQWIEDEFNREGPAYFSI